MRRLRKPRRAPKLDLPVADINTTPLIDVMLVLLVMLIITIPAQLHSVNLNLPLAAPSSPPPVPPEVLRVDIDARSQVFTNGQAQADTAALRQRLAQAAAQAQPPEVHVRPQPGARYARFAEVMVAVQQSGLRKLGVVGSEQFLQE
jgi:biopolymer transport protein ExbD